MVPTKCLTEVQAPTPLLIHQIYGSLEAEEDDHISNFRAFFLRNYVTLTWTNQPTLNPLNQSLPFVFLLFNASPFSFSLEKIQRESLLLRQKKTPLLFFPQDSEITIADSVSDMEMESSKVQEAAKVEESDKKIDPEPMKSEDSEEEPDHTNVLALDMKDPVEEPNPTRVLVLDMILKSLWKISVFSSDLLLDFCQETHHSLTEDGEYVVPPSSQLRGFILNNLSVAHPLEPKDVFDFLVTILELLPLWRSGNSEEEPLNSKFEVYEVAKKKCNRCRLDIESPVECSYGLLLDANSLREIKSAFKDMTFENVVKVIRITLMMPCDKEGCGKRNYVERMIDKLPFVFTIALEWENNETGEEILASTSVLATEIDISEIYKYEGDSVFTKYHLVSMVCCGGDQYSCIAYERGSWVIHFGTGNEVIGDWKSVLSMFLKLNIRPKILFFENVVRRCQIMGTDQTV